jgi:hypothetical protein
MAEPLSNAAKPPGKPWKRGGHDGEQNAVIMIHFEPDHN